MSQRYEGAVRALSKVMAELTAARAENRSLRRELKIAREGLARIESGVAAGWVLEDVAHQAHASLVSSSPSKPKRGAKAKTTKRATKRSGE